MEDGGHREGSDLAVVTLEDVGVSIVEKAAGRDAAAVTKFKVSATVLGNVGADALAVLIVEICCDCGLHVLVCSRKHLVLWKYLSQLLQIDGRDLVSKI